MNLDINKKTSLGIADLNKVYDHKTGAIALEGRQPRAIATDAARQNQSTDKWTGVSIGKDPSGVHSFWAESGRGHVVKGGQSFGLDCSLKGGLFIAA